MTRSPSTSTSLRSLFVAAVLLALSVTPAGAQEPGGGEPGAGAEAPEDRGVVHSWALVPGDGSLEAGERPTLSYELDPGAQVADVVTLYNYSNVELTFDLYATDGLNNEDGLFDLLAADEEPTGVGTWIALPQASITVPAETQATLPVTVRVPVDARPGDHAGALLAASQARGTGPDGEVVTLDRRTGSRVYVRVAGPLQPELAVEDLSTSYASALNPLGGRAEVRYRIVNRGNVRLGVRHRVSVAGPLGLMRKSTDNQEVLELLPGESIEVTRTIESVVATGLLFTDVDLVPVSLSGRGEELDPADRKSFGFAVPFTVVAAVIVVALAAYARRSYLRHRTEGGTDDGTKGGTDGGDQGGTERGDRRGARRGSDRVDPVVVGHQPT